MKTITTAIRIAIPIDATREYLQRELENAKDRCRKNIKSKLDTNKISGNLDDIEYAVYRFPEDEWQPTIAYIIKAILKV